MPLVKRLQHLALEVSDTDRAVAFYRDMFGFKLTERHKAHEVAAIPVELTFMRLGAAHHDLVLVHNPAKTYAPRPARPEDDLAGAPSFHHFALECDSRADWLAMVEQLRAKGARVVRGPVKHSMAHPAGDGSWGENEAIYVLDPDGHRIEIFCDLARVAGAAQVDRTGAEVPGARVEEV